MTAKQVLANKIEKEKDEKFFGQRDAIDRLHEPEAMRNRGAAQNMYAGEEGSSKRMRRGSATFLEQVQKQKSWRFGDPSLTWYHNSNASDFRKSVLYRFKSYIAGSDAMDTNNNGVLDWREFIAACFKARLQGNLKLIFDELTGGRDEMVLSDLDPSLKEEQERRDRERELKEQARREEQQKKLQLPFLERLSFVSDEKLMAFGSLNQHKIRSAARDRLPDQSHSESPKARQRGFVIATVGEA